MRGPKLLGGGLAALLAGCAPVAPAAAPLPAGGYTAVVVSESADRVAWIGFDGAEARVLRERTVGTRPTEMDGPHGVAVSPDGRFYYVTLGHGTPFGTLWKYATANDEPLGRTTLGHFPATVDVTPDGEYAFVANFNLHGDHVPSSVSKVHLPTMAEVARAETCTMPHGSRVSRDGAWQYSTCMMDDLMVEIEVATGEPSTFFSVQPGREHGMPAARYRMHHGPGGHHGGAHAAEHGAEHGEATGAVCSPTWAQPGPDGRHLYVACNGNREVLEIAREGWSVTRRFATGENPYNVEVTPDGRYLLVTLRSRTAAAVEVHDLRTGRRAASIATSTSLAHGLAVTADSRFAFVSVEGVGAEPGKVDVIDLASLRRVASVEVGQQAAGIAVMR
jgi:DNA-binding beta-propeller fold protein YncE